MMSLTIWAIVLFMRRDKMYILTVSVLLPNHLLPKVIHETFDNKKDAKAQMRIYKSIFAGDIVYCTIEKVR